MKQKESNTLIAEFMGMNYGDPNDNSVMIQMTPQGNEVVPINSMEYHSSWDWLMPVVKKCFQTGDDTHQWDNIMDTIFTCDINIVYAQVVEFIKEYNKDYKTCDRCCFDIVDDDGDIMEHICIDDELY